MIKLKKDNKRKEEEKKIQDEAEAAGIKVEKKVKKSPAELRLQGEVQELDIPAHAKCTFNPESLLNFKLNVDLSNEVCLW